MGGKIRDTERRKVAGISFPRGCSEYPGGTEEEESRKSKENSDQQDTAFHFEVKPENKNIASPKFIQTVSNAYGETGGSRTAWSLA